MNLEQITTSVRNENGLYSVYDVIKLCGQKSPNEVWKRLTAKYPEIVPQCDLISFIQKSGRRGRKTPAATLKVCEDILKLLKGHPDQKAVTSEKYYPRVESQVVSVLEKSFQDLEPCTQFYCSGYRVDLYLAKIRLAIECDENGHRDYSTKGEMKREKLIKQSLGCSFVRFDPFCPDFNIGDLIYQIRQYTSR